MYNHNPNYGDNMTCDCCGDVFNARNSGDTVECNGEDKFICSECSELPDEELKEAIAIYAGDGVKS